MSSSFDESRQMAADNISDMERQLSRMMRTYNNYIKHNAVNAAAELMVEIESLECGIACEEDMFRLAFY